MWYSLDKPKKSKRQGLIKTRLIFTSEKISEVAMQEHRHLLRILLLHELENSKVKFTITKKVYIPNYLCHLIHINNFKVAQYWWAGTFSVHAEAIISQHSAQSGINQINNFMAQWTVYSAIHVDHPLSFALFTNLLNKLSRSIETNLICDEEIKLFWDGVRKILPSCFSIIRKIRKKTTGDKNVLKILKDVLILLSMVSELKVPEDIDLFPTKQYGWLKRNDNVAKGDVKDVMLQAIHQGASEWFIELVDTVTSEDKSEEGRLQNSIKIIQMVRSDMQRAVEYYDKCFAQ